MEKSRPNNQENLKSKTLGEGVEILSAKNLDNEKMLLESLKKVPAKTLEEKNQPSSTFKEKTLDEEKVEKNDTSPMKTVRTYKSDVFNILRKQKTSLTDMTISEKKKRINKKNILTENENNFLQNKKIISLLIIITIIFISGGFYFLKPKTNNTGVNITEVKIPSFIFVDYQREIFLSNLKKKRLTNILTEGRDNISIPLGSMIQIYLTKEDPTKSFIIENTKDYKLLVTSEVFFNSLETKAPAYLTRALKSDFMLGYYSSLGNNPFLIFKIKSYDNVFAGMLEWEENIFNDLAPILKIEGSDADTLHYKFQDIVVANKDVRAILNNKGKIEFAYSFVNKDTLVIANNENVFKEIFRRLTMASLRR